MKLNRIQVEIFKQLSGEMGTDVDSYIKDTSMEFIGVQRDRLEDLSEEEGDTWINKMYVLSLADFGNNIPQ